MPENKIVDPFKPAQPRIPGVAPREEEKAKPNASEGHSDSAEAAGTHPGEPSGAHGTTAGIHWNLQFVWMGLVVAGAVVTAFLLFRSNGKHAATSVGAVVEPATVAAAPAAAPVAATPQLPIGPGTIATTAQLAKAWSAKKFYFIDPVNKRSIPAMVVRLPGGDYWGFSLQEPFGDCELEYVTDLGKLRTRYGFEAAAYPMVADPCNGTVFDLTRYGSGPSGLVRGEIAKGSGWRPPTAIEIRVRGNKVMAERMER